MVKLVEPELEAVRKAPTPGTPPMLSPAAVVSEIESDCSRPLTPCRMLPPKVEPLADVNDSVPAAPDLTVPSTTMLDNCSVMLIPPAAVTLLSVRGKAKLLFTNETPPPPLCVAANEATEFTWFNWMSAAAAVSAAALTVAPAADSVIEPLVACRSTLPEPALMPLLVSEIVSEPAETASETG